MRRALTGLAVGIVTAVLWVGAADAQTTTTEDPSVTTTTAAAADDGTGTAGDGATDPLTTGPTPETGGGLMAGASAGAGFLALASVTRRFLRR